MRYLPLTDRDRGEMLAAIGVDSIDALFADVPGPARLEGLIDLDLAHRVGEVDQAFEPGRARHIREQRVDRIDADRCQHLATIPIRQREIPHQRCSSIKRL